LARRSALNGTGFRNASPVLPLLSFFFLSIYLVLLSCCEEIGQVHCGSPPAKSRHVADLAHFVQIRSSPSDRSLPFPPFSLRPSALLDFRLALADSVNRHDCAFITCSLLFRSYTFFSTQRNPSAPLLIPAQHDASSLISGYVSVPYRDDPSGLLEPLPIFFFFLCFLFFQRQLAKVRIAATR